MKQRVAFLGPAGTYSEAAAQRYFSAAGAAIELVPCETFDAVVAAVEQGKATAGVLPLENSVEGSVQRVLDLLAGTQLIITGELVLPIWHCLWSRAASLQDITEVWAHPQALAQCRAWLEKNLPHAAQHAARSNAEAAQLAGKTPHAAAIAGERAGELYGLRALAKRIEDNPRNTTRFVVVGAAAAPATGAAGSAAAAHAMEAPSGPEPTGNDKTSLVCALPNSAGSLYGLLGIFAKHQVNLTKLESRPLPDRLWEYRFYIDCDGHAAESKLAAALQEVEQYAAEYRLLGSYPKASTVTAEDAA